MTARAAVYLFDIQIEEIVMASRQGQRALGLGVGASIMSHAIADLGKVKTERRLVDWLEALDERWFQARVRDRKMRQADIVALELASAKSGLPAAGLNLMTAPDRKEQELLETYGKREPVHA